MKFRSNLPPKDAPTAAVVVDRSTSLPLPRDVREKVTRALDEPARQQFALVSRDCAALVRQSRRGAALPTRLELFDCGFPRLDHQKVLDAFAPNQGPTLSDGTPLHRHYRQGAALQAAEKMGVAGKIMLYGGDYVGGLEGASRHGFGFWSSRADGRRYEGEYKNSKYHGRGIWVAADGSRYEGEFRDGKYHGRGVYVRPNGSRYEGEFRDGNQHGRGILVVADGSRYEGEFRDSKCHGRGIWVAADGRRYEGEFRNSKRHGRGIFTDTDGSRREVMYKEDQLSDGEAPSLQPQPALVSTPRPKSVLSRLKKAFRRNLLSF